MVEADGARFIEAHVAATLEECEARDVKGLYAEARAGKRPGFTGIDDPYEKPLNPELVIPTGQESLHDSLSRVLTYLSEERLVDAVLERAG